jgi:hypothetical protein
VQHVLDFSAHAALAAGLLRQQLRDETNAYNFLASRHQTCIAQNTELSTQLSDLRVESDNRARVDDENVELSEKTEELRYALRQSEQENTHLTRSLQGSRHQLNETSRRNLELLRKLPEQAHNVMHSTSEMHESQEARRSRKGHRGNTLKNALRQTSIPQGLAADVNALC